MNKQKLYSHIGTMEYSYNLYDEAIRVLDFEILSPTPLTMKDLKVRILTDYSDTLGTATRIGTVSYTTGIILMGGK